MRTILEVICRRFPTIVWITVVLLAVVVVGSYVVTPQYVSEARITVPIGQESAVPATTMTQPLNVFINRAEQIQTQIGVLYSRNLIEKTIDAFPEGYFEGDSAPPDDFMERVRYEVRENVRKVSKKISSLLEKVGLTTPMSDRERLVLNFARKLTAKRQRETDLIILSFEHPSPQVAQAFLTKFLEVYVREKSISDSGVSVPFFAEQEAQLNAELATARVRLSDFRAEWGILDLDTQRDALLKEYTRLTGEININNAELVENEVTLENFLKDLGKASPESVMPMVMRNDMGMAEVLRNLAQLRARESRLSTEMGENHPDRANITKEISRLQSHLSEEGKNMLGNRVTVLRALLEELEEQRDVIHEGILTLDAKSREMRTLESEVSVMERASAQYAEKRETSRVSAAMDAQQINAIRVIEPPNLAYEPSSPKKVRNIMLGLVLGVIAGLAYVFFRHQFGTTIYTPEDLHASLQAFEEDDEEFRENHRKVAIVGLPDLNYPRTPGLLRRLLPLPKLFSVSSAEAVVKKMPENIKTMTGRKFFYRRNERILPKSLMVTGTGPSVGNTSCVRLLADHLCKVYGQRVLVVDTYFKKVPRKANVTNGNDFASWLRGGALVAPESNGNQIVFLDAGILDDQANSAFFALKRESLAGIQAGYDIVLFDAAPVSRSSISLHLAALMDEVILVARSEVTRREVVVYSRDTLDQCGALLKGTICNRRRMYIPNWLYRMLE